MRSMEARPTPDSTFYLEELLDYYNARRMLVERGGHVMFRYATNCTESGGKGVR